MTTQDIKLNNDENFEWSVENEIRLFEAMLGHKPVGINRHFHMACICERFEDLIGKPISADTLWKHLNTMYDMAALDKKETIPFPNQEEEFSLPEAEYSELMNQKIANTKVEALNEALVKDGRTTPKTLREQSQNKDVLNKKEKEKEREKEKEKEKEREKEKEKEKDKEKDKEKEKERKNEQEETEVEGNKKESENVTDSKKGKSKKERRQLSKRGKQNPKEKKVEGEPVTESNSKRKVEEGPSASQNNSKKRKVVGKRTLRSRNDESSSNKSSTPPPPKRARRI